MYVTYRGNSKYQFDTSNSGKSLYILAINIKLLFVCMMGFGMPVLPLEWMMKEC